MFARVDGLEEDDARLDPGPGEVHPTLRPVERHDPDRCWDARGSRGRPLTRWDLLRGLDSPPDGDGEDHDEGGHQNVDARLPPDRPAPLLAVLSLERARVGPN